MSCALTQNYTLDCKDGVGGLKYVFIIEKDNATLTYSTGTISAVVNATSKKWWKYELVKETASFKETMNDNVQNGTTFYTQELEIVLNKLQTATRNELLLLGKAHLWIIAVDFNGKNWLLGYQNGVDRSGGSSETGKAYGDRNGYTISFKGMEPELAIEVTSAAVGTNFSTLTTARS